MTLLFWLPLIVVVLWAYSRGRQILSLHRAFKYKTRCKCGRKH